MGSRAANIKIKLSSGAFTGELRRTEQKVKASGKRMGKSLGREMDAGLMRGQRALANMGKSLGRMIKQAGTIGAAFATGALVKDSLDVHKSFQDISFLLSRIPAQAMSWQEVQTLVTAAANDTTRTTKEMAGAFEQVYKATGDLKYSKEILNAIGRTATASGKPIEQIAQVAEMVRRKWKVTGKAAEDAIAQFVEKADKGGLSLDQLSSRLDAVAGEASELGMDVSELLGTITQLDATMGAMAPRGMKTLLQYIKEGATQTQRLEKAGRFKFEPNMDALDRIRMIVKSPKAHKEALEVFTETSRTAFDELRKPFTETLEAARKAGMTEEVAQKKALAAYDEMVRQIRKTEMTAADIDRLYEQRIESDPSIKIRQALNKVRDAFAQPKMLDAIGKLADKLPSLAKVVADVVSFIADSPLMAAGVGLGLRAGVPMLMGGFGGAGSAGGAVATQGTSRALGNVGRASAGAKTNIRKMGTAAGNVVGKLAGVASLGYTLGKLAESYIEKESEEVDKRQARQAKSVEAYTQAIRTDAKGVGTSVEEKIKAMEVISKAEKGAIGDIRKTSPLEYLQQSIEAHMGQRSFADVGVDLLAQKERQDHARRIAELDRKIMEQIIARKDAEVSAAKDAKEVADAWGRAADAFKDASKAHGAGVTKKGKAAVSRGNRRLPPSVPGSEPIEG